MARTLRIVSWLAVCLAAATGAGCITRVVVGVEDGGASASSSAAASTGGPGTTTTGAVATSTGSTSATASGASGTGTGGSSGGTSTSGGTTGTPDSGCRPLAATCSTASDCCSGSCGDGEYFASPGASVCTQAVGAGCFLPSDCGSNTCTNDACACSDFHCASAADCCDGICGQFDADEHFCCVPAGSGPCTSSDPENCCSGYMNCVDGLCACAQPGGTCQADGDCCAGHCLPYFFSRYDVDDRCLLGRDDACDVGSDCYSGACVDGGCAVCGGPLASCAEASDCCDGMACAATLLPLPVPGNGPLILYDAGAYCCSPSGGSCADAGDCCSLECTDGECACLEPGEGCTNDQACCWGACLAAFGSQNLATACCNLDGQGCGMPGDCCSGHCDSDQQCACVPDGGHCGPLGAVAALGPAACCSGACNDAGACE